MGILKNIFRIIKAVKENNAIAKEFYSMSVEELRALSNEKLNDAIDTILYFYEDIDDLDNYNEVQLTAITIKCFDNEIQNGGLCQFFVNSSSDYAPYVVESLHRINATQTNQMFKEFIEENQIDLYDLSSFRIYDVEEFKTQKNRYPFDEFDDKYYENYANENLQDLLVEYVRNNIELAFSLKK